MIPHLNFSFAFGRYYCSKACQVSDWPCHKEYHKSLEKERGKGSQHMQHALGSLALNDDGAVAKAGSGEEIDANGMTALLRAASDNNWREVRKLILGGADPSVADGQGLTALHYAAFHGGAKLARTLIENGPAGLVLGEAPGGLTSLILARPAQAEILLLQRCSSRQEGRRFFSRQTRTDAPASITLAKKAILRLPRL